MHTAFRAQQAQRHALTPLSSHEGARAPGEHPAQRSRSAAAPCACTRMAAEQPDALFHIDEDATLYELLGVTPDVGIAEIKQAYKKQALRWHPDKCTEPNAEDVFKRINTAYGVLSEDSKRAEYDHSLSCGSNPYAGGVDSGEHCGAGGAAAAAAAAYEAWQAFLWAEEQERLSRARRERRCLYGMVSLVLWGAAPLLLLWLLATPWTVLL